MKATLDDEDDNEPTQVLPVTPKLAGIISNLKNAIKQKIGDRSPESANPSGISVSTPHPTIKVLPAKCPAVSSASIHHLASDKPPLASPQTSCFELTLDLALVQSMANMNMGPPPSHTPSVM